MEPVFLKLYTILELAKLFGCGKSRIERAIVKMRLLPYKSKINGPVTFFFTEADVDVLRRHFKRDGN